jgi:small subunit ribosomal protein S16
MALKIRLARGGTKKRPFYRIVIAEASSPRDGRFVERIGSYNPMLPTGHENRLVLDGERAKYWMSKGAKPTLRVHKMMAGIGLLDSPEIREQPKKSAFGKKRQEREDAAAEAAEAAAAEAAEAAEAAAAPAEDTPAEAPAEDTPAEEAPAEDTPVEEAPAEEAPAEAPAEEVPAEAPAEDTSAEDTPAEDKAE